MKYNEWLMQANESINDAVAKCLNSARHGGWNENHITTNILDALNALGEEITWDDLNQKIIWEGYKLTGAAESQYGDIAVLVRVWLTSDSFVDGVAYYEAKRQYFKKDGTVNGFLSIKSEQLARLRSLTHASSVIFYDADVNDSRVYVGCVPNVFVGELTKINMINQGDRNIHRYGRAWVYNLLDNLRGFSLDYSPNAVEAIKDFANSQFAPLVVLNAAVGKINIEPKLSEHCASLLSYEKIWGAAPTITENPEPPRDSGPRP